MFANLLLGKLCNAGLAGPSTIKAPKSVGKSSSAAALITEMTDVVAQTTMFESDVSMLGASK